MRKRQFSFLIIVSAMLFSMLQGSPLQVKAAPENSSALPAELVFCGVFPISQRPDAGPDRRDGFLLAVDEINAQTGTDRILPVGVTIKGIALDDENTASGGTAAAQSCITQGAHIVIGSSGSSVSAAMATELTPQKIPQISYASSSPSLSNRTAYPYFMRNAASDAWQGVALADVVDALGFTKGAIIHTDDSYGSGLPAVFKANWDGTVDTTQTYQAQATDVTAQVQALKDSVDNNGVEFILLNAIDEDAKTVLQEARDLGLTGGNITFILTDGSTTTSTFAGSDDVKEAMQGAVGTTPASLGGAPYNAFVTLWNAKTTCGDINPCANARTGKVPNSYAPLAYDATYIAAMGFADALAADAGFDANNGDDRVTTLLDALYNVTLDGAGGTVAFDDLGEVVGRYDVVTLVNSGWFTIGEWQGTLTLTNIKYLLYNWAGPGGSTPGFEGLTVLFGVFALVAIQIVRKTRK